MWGVRGALAGATIWLARTLKYERTRSTTFGGGKFSQQIRKNEELKLRIFNGSILASFCTFLMKFLETTNTRTLEISFDNYEEKQSNVSLSHLGNDLKSYKQQRKTTLTANTHTTTQKTKNLPHLGYKLVLTNSLEMKAMEILTSFSRHYGTHTSEDTNTFERVISCHWKKESRLSDKQKADGDCYKAEVSAERMPKEGKNSLDSFAKDNKRPFASRTIITKAKELDTSLRRAAEIVDYESVLQFADKCEDEEALVQELLVEPCFVIEEPAKLLEKTWKNIHKKCNAEVFIVISFITVYI